jgi:hypothetical protein
MPTTSNFGWTTPADTDLVKDGAAAIRTLGNGIDSSFLDLKGGTTGQNLRKASNTDLDFTFAGDATNTVVDAAGDLLYGTASDTLGRLAIGTAGQVLKVNSGATAPEWGSASASYAWTTWTPTWTNLTVGNGSVTARYVQIDKLVVMEVYLVWGSTTSASGEIKVSKPVNANQDFEWPSFNLWIRDASAGVRNFGFGLNDSATTVSLRVLNASGTYATADNISNTVPFTWAVNDSLNVIGYYESV